MNASKVREMIADIERQRGVLERAVAGLREVLATLESDGPADGQEAAASIVSPGRQTSYIRDGVSILEAEGKPLHVSVIVDRIKQRRASDDILRGSVESSFLRHIRTQRGHAKIVKTGRSTFGLPGWRSASSASVVERQLQMQ